MAVLPSGGTVESDDRQDAQTSPAGRTRILVVDDNPEVSDVIQYCLETDGFDVACAQDGKSARQVLDGDRINLALIDVVLPDEGGLALAAHAARRGIPVLLMTGHPDAMKASSSHHTIAKPFDLTELCGLLRRILKLPGTPR